MLFLVSSPQTKAPSPTVTGLRVVGKGPPPLPAAAPSAVPLIVNSAPPDPGVALQQAIAAAIAPLLRKQQELETRLEREVADRLRLREDVERLRSVSLAVPASPVVIPDMLDGAQRGRRVQMVILFIVAIVLCAAVGAMLLSQTR